MSDSQLMDLDKNLEMLDLEGNEILEKNTKFAKCVSGKDATNRLDDLNETLTNALEKETDFIKAVRQEVPYRDLSEEKKIKNALGVKIQLPFKGYDSVMDIYTFKTQFEKCVEPYV